MFFLDSFFSRLMVEHQKTSKIIAIVGLFHLFFWELETVIIYNHVIILEYMQNMCGF